MINKLISYLNPFGASTTTYDNKTLEKLTLFGELFLKEIGKPIEQIGEEVQISLFILDEAKCLYELQVLNLDYNDQTDTWERMKFNITNECHFKIFKNADGVDTLLWERGATFFILHIWIDDTTRDNKKPFLKILSEFITSNDFKITLAQAETETTKDQFIVDYNTIENVDQFWEENYKQTNEENTIEVWIDAMSNVNIKSDLFLTSFPKAKEMFHSSDFGVLYKYNKQSDNLAIWSETAIIKIYDVDKFSYYLTVEESDSMIVYTKISENSYITAKPEDNTIVFVCYRTYNKNKTETSAYTFVFGNKTDVLKIKKLIVKCNYEARVENNYESWNETDRMWLEKESSDDESDNTRSANEVDFDTDFGQNMDNTNKFTTQAYTFDRTFTLNENGEFNIFKTSDNQNNLEYMFNLPAIKEYNGKDINITNAHLFNSDTNFLWQDRNNPDTWLQYDILSNKIVSEWNAGSVKEICEFTHEKKYDQKTNNQVMIGINNKNLFTWDGRWNKKNKVVDIKTGVATGSYNGDIRLYSEIGKNAKSLLSGYGDAIRAIDVTGDGKYVLATCDKYLLIINTELKNGSNGFVSQLAKEKNSHGPKTLKLKPVDIIRYELEAQNFTPAKFNINTEDAERTINTSIGEYIVIWNFSKVKKGILDSYKVKKVNQFVIGNLSKYNKDEVVVTMPNIVRIQKQKIFK